MAEAVTPPETVPAMTFLEAIDKVVAYSLSDERDYEKADPSPHNIFHSFLKLQQLADCLKSDEVLLTDRRVLGGVVNLDKVAQDADWYYANDANGVLDVKGGKPVARPQGRDAFTKLDARRKGGMNGFLLLARGGMDDPPIGLYATLTDALEAAKHFTEENVQDISDEVLGCSPSEVTHISVVEFVSGSPCGEAETARDFAGE
jgi:hypothetical protein